MSEERVVYSSDPKDVIKRAVAQGLTTKQIVVALTICRAYPEVRAIAEKYAPVLGIKVVEFVRMAGPRS